MNSQLAVSNAGVAAPAAVVVAGGVVVVVVAGGVVVVVVAGAFVVVADENVVVAVADVVVVVAAVDVHAEARTARANQAMAAILGETGIAPRVGGGRGCAVGSPADIGTAGGNRVSLLDGRFEAQVLDEGGRLVLDRAGTREVED